MLLQRLMQRAIEQAIHECVPPWVIDHCIQELKLESFNNISDDKRALIVCTKWWWRDAVSKRIVNEQYVRYQVRLSIASKFQKRDEDPTAAMKGQLSARAELHHFRLNQHFPKRVREVKIEMNEDKAEPYVIVYFLNGHKLVRRECEIMTTDFLALCAMIYDLPPKGD